MKLELFFECLIRFDSFNGKTNFRNVVLEMDNAYCHGNLETILKLRDVQIVDLPTNTTSLLQLLDAGTTPVLKRKYRKCHVMKAPN